MAYRADTGEKLLEIKTGLRGGMGPPMTYMLDGKQYVTLAGGTGRVTPGADAPPRPPTDGPGPSLPKMLTFVLDGTAALPGE
jgi:quinohemoprotein ethanol dehydrogenase